MDIAGSLTAITAALGVVKELREIDAQFDKAEMKLKIAELTSALAEAKLGMVDVAQLLRDKDEEIEKLTSSFKRRAETVERDGYQYRMKENGEPVGDPFCPVCLDDGTFILTVQNLESGMPHKCPKCKSSYGYLPSYI